MDLGLERGLIPVDTAYKTCIDGIYAIGDVIKGGIQLAHAASAEGVNAVCGMFGEKSNKNLDYVPSCIYTSPEIASVGITADMGKRFPKQVACVYCSGGSRNINCEFGCIGCGACVEACRLKAIKLNDFGVAEVDTEKCVNCGLCMKAWPSSIRSTIALDVTLTASICSGSVFPRALPPSAITILLFFFMVAIGSGVKSCLSEFLSQLVRSKILIAELAYVASRLLGDVLGDREGAPQHLKRVQAKAVRLVLHINVPEPHVRGDSYESRC